MYYVVRREGLVLCVDISRGCIRSVKISLFCFGESLVVGLDISRQWVERSQEFIGSWFLVCICVGTVVS